MPITDEASAIFTEARAAAVALARSLSSDEASRPVPACPAWTVRDVFAHVAGIVDDIMEGRVEGLGSDAWTAAQIERRHGHTLAQIGDEYEELGQRFDPWTAANPDIGAAGAMSLPMRLTADLTVHLGDVAAALGREPDRRSRALQLTLARYAPAFVDRVAGAGLTPVRVEAIDLDGPVAYGPDQPDDGGGVLLVLRAPACDLVRATAGRRSAAQVAAMDWSGDPAAHVSLISSYGLPAVDGD